MTASFIAANVTLRLQEKRLIYLRLTNIQVALVYFVVDWKVLPDFRLP